MDKLIHGLATLAERTDTEVTIAFDGQLGRPEPIAVPRDVQVLYSAPDQRVEELMMTLVRTSTRAASSCRHRERTHDQHQRQAACFIRPSERSGHLA